ncbi:MAG: imidazoleglycerol-phosphate dehydratase [Eggerthellaceae bacterium]|nr:imidazoleglycerol-phosphate dehydratase [Eggerthellaceae bacterium]
MNRIAEIKRTTAETDIALTLNLDGSGKASIDTGIGFLDHMLTLLAVHGNFDLDVKCVGDTYVDDHHSTEDIAICLGKAFSQAVGNKAGIARYGFMILPMDEALCMSEIAIREAVEKAEEEADGGKEEPVILSAVDISGRDLLAYGLFIPAEKVGTFDTELVEEFWLGFVRNANITLHIQQLAGTNSHHIIECAFKCIARALRQAVAVDEKAAEAGVVPSSKGSL